MQIIIREVHYSRKRQVRQFEPEELGIVAAVPDGMDPILAAQEAKAWVAAQLGLPVEHIVASVSEEYLSEGSQYIEMAAQYIGLVAADRGDPPHDVPAAAPEPRFMGGFVTDSQLQYLYKLLKKSHGGEAEIRTALCRAYNLADVYALPKKAASDLINRLKEGGDLA